MFWQPARGEREGEDGRKYTLRAMVSMKPAPAHAHDRGTTERDMIKRGTRNKDSGMLQTIPSRCHPSKTGFEAESKETSRVR